MIELFDHEANRIMSCLYENQDGVLAHVLLPESLEKPLESFTEQTAIRIRTIGRSDWVEITFNYDKDSNPIMDKMYIWAMETNCEECSIIWQRGKHKDQWSPWKRKIRSGLLLSIKTRNDFINMHLDKLDGIVRNNLIGNTKSQ